MKKIRDTPSFYKGNKLLSSKVISNYIDGFYMNYSTGIGIKEPLNNKVNKYNKELIGKLNDFNSSFYSIIMLDKLTLKLIELNDNFSYGDKKNIFRLMYAQGGTIRYNKLLKNALRTYGITKQKILDELNTDIAKQQERIDRNKRLLIELWEEYGISKLLKIVEKENNKSIFDIIMNFIDEKLVGVIITDDNIDTVYDNIVEEYVTYLKEVANKNNIDINGEISESLVKHREYRNKIREEIREEDKQRKLNERIATATKVIYEDNIKIQNDINTDDECKLQKLDFKKARKMLGKVEELGGSVYYVALCKTTKVVYPLDSSANTLSQDIAKVPLFKSLEDATKFKQHIMDVMGSNIYIRELQLISDRYTFIKNKNTVYVNSIIDNLSYIINCPTTYNEAYIAKKALRISNGIDPKTHIGAVIIYTIEHIDEKNSLISKPKYIVENNKAYGVSDKIKTNILMHSIEQAKHFNVQNIKITNTEYNKYIVKRHIINFDIQWYKDSLKELDNENKFFIDLMNSNTVPDINKYDIHDKHILSFTYDYFLDLKKRFRDIFDKNNTNCMYYITEGYGKTYFYRESSKDKRTDSLRNITLLCNYDDALKALNHNYDMYNQKIMRVYPICVYN